MAAASLFGLNGSDARNIGVHLAIRGIAIFTECGGFAGPEFKIRKFGVRMNGRMDDEIYELFYPFY